MAIDPYQLCPCGGGKKVKFCCCKDITADLDKVLRILEGEQRLAGLEQLNRLIQSKGERPGLLALKCEVQVQLNELDAAVETIEKFLKDCPDNPVALAQSAMLDASEERSEAAVEKLHQAIENIEETMPMPVFEAIGVIGQMFLGEGNIIAGRSHLLLQATLAGEDDPRAMQMLMRLHSSQQVPLLLKQDYRFADTPDDQPWREDFDKAMQLAYRGAWLAALEEFESLPEDALVHEATLKNTAILNSWLGDRKAAASDWHDYAELGELPLEDAVEAEALAQLLDHAEQADTIDVVTLGYAINDMDKLMERLAIDKRASRMPLDPGSLGTEDAPPPKGVYWLLDRPLPETGVGITRDDAPHVLGEMYVFGKQTDRDARLELVVSKTHDFEANKAALAELTDGLLGDVVGEEVTDDVDVVSAALTWNWRLPDDTPMKLRGELIAEERRNAILNRWQEVPQKIFDGKRPSDVASNPKYRVPVLAAILLLELAGDVNGSDKLDFNQLREQLGLPTCGAIDPGGIDLSRVPLVRLSRVSVEKLTDEDLVQSYQRAGRLGALKAVGHLAKEVVDRDSLDEQVDKSEAYELLAKVSADSADAISYLRKARDIAVAGGRSPASWMIAELAMRLERDEPEGVENLIQQIQSRHINEPGVAEGLMEVLYRFGIINPDGSFAGPPSASEPSLVGAGESASEASSELWTPDGPASGGGEEGESKLWLPGMD